MRNLHVCISGNFIDGIIVTTYVFKYTYWYVLRNANIIVRNDDKYQRKTLQDCK